VSALCFMGIHKYEMFKYVDKKGRFITLGRDCKWCGKSQVAVRPKEYHPTLYVWQDQVGDL
jgi:hypothetical protein